MPRQGRKVAPTFDSVLLTNSNFAAEYSRGKGLLANGVYTNQAESLDVARCLYF